MHLLMFRLIPVDILNLYHHSEKQKQILIVLRLSELQESWGGQKIYLTGKAQEVCSALPIESSLDYDTIKVAVLRVYELVPEAY